MNVFLWLQNNWQDLVSVYTGLVAAAAVAVKLTPTLKDDNWLLAVVKFVAKYVALARTVNDQAVREKK